MTPCKKAILALFIVSSVSAELSVLVTGMPHEEIGENLDLADGAPATEKAHPEKLNAQKAWEGFENVYNNDDISNRAEYQRFLGIDPLTNPFINEMNYNNEGGAETHMVRKRVLPFSEEFLTADKSPADSLDLLETKEKYPN